MVFPKAREDKIVVQEISDELVIYDLQRDRVHTLNPTAAFVWQHCDGKTSTSELASKLQDRFDTPHADDLLWLGLDRLEKANLLESEVTSAVNVKITRRQVLQKIGVSVVMLPVVASIVAPTAQAASSDCDNSKSFSSSWLSCSATGWINGMCTELCSGQYETGHFTCSGYNPIEVVCCCN